ncbi:S8 family serine peptidase [Streptomyces sp. SID3343]|uniref:S8 family peptidase n=1 Tax=Streptomyces sp. SID3343 TaxID=2690260 RepID=UPI001371BFDD|nr:S8 family serine peptidase [Streptomyces sp. SID3343]MYV97594.1 S8 family serine peptidase [Streptomyces sp. SID3343]
MTTTRTDALTWNLLDRRPCDIPIATADAGLITPEWAYGGADGSGVRVCVVDSGIEAGHPLIGELAGSYAVLNRDEGPEVGKVDPGDTCGHGTACASIVRRIAPGCELHSVRILGEKGGGTGDALLTGLRWAIEQRFEVINLSLSTSRPQFNQELRELADDAYFNGSVIVASAHNSRIESFPWRFSSVISVGSHAEDDSALVLYNPSPPVEFFARGQAVPVAGPNGGTTRNTGNSFAAPHIAGLSALILGKHPSLTPFELKTILYLTAANVRGA